MKERCNLKTDPSYKNYGGRGIKVCKRWEKFSNFWEDVKDIYKDDLTIDRIDNNKGYYKENCRWATLKEQANNMRTNIVVKYNSNWYRPVELNKITGIPLKTIYYRFEKRSK